MRYILIFLTACSFQISNAQTAEDSVKAVVNMLFEGMKSANADLVKSTFADSAVLQTIRRNRDGSFFVDSENPAEFATIVGQAKKDSLDERISFDAVLIDGPLAVVWTPYKFYYAGNFSHCGVNSFQLVKIGGEWKIQYLIDTRRRQGCE